jgi:hypothetical protein
MLRVLLAAISLISISACNSGGIQDAIDLADGVPRKTINTDILGVNAFANDGRFGSAQQQFNEVQSTLRLGFVRILVNWDSLAQPSKSSPANFSFFDSVISSIPAGLDALLVVTGAPDWMSNPANWTNGDPRKTFIEEWVAPAVRRYGGNPRVIGFQVWNEPNQNSTANQALQVNDNAALYVELLAAGAAVVRANAPAKLVVTAATSAINQNYPNTLNYNRAMRDAGAEQHADIWGMHYYGKQYENLIRSGGVKDFANGLSLPIWVTESGAQGVNNQLAYGEEVWPYLTDNISRIQRIYVYQFTEASPPEVTYGLRNLSSGLALSDLYIWLRDRS